MKFNEIFFLKLRLATIYYQENNFDKANFLIKELLESNFKCQKEVKILSANIKIKEGNLISAYPDFKSVIEDNKITL